MKQILASRSAIKQTLAFTFLVLIYSQAFCLEVGDMAPDFSLQGTDGKIHKLSDYRSKQAVILAWFPKAYTRGCTIECKSLAENGHLLKKHKVTYFMSSVDSIADNTGFAKEQKADFVLLSDPSKETAKAYDVLSVFGYSVRHTFYIGKEGKILAIDKNVKPATSAQDMATMLSKLGIPLMDNKAQ